MNNNDNVPVLFAHQELGADWLAATRCGGLFDEQGLGKTATAIVAAQRLGAKKILVLAPTVVAHNWRREFATWDPARRVEVVTSGSQRRDPLADVTVTTHGLLLSDAVFRTLCGTGMRWDLVIVDEAHNFRNPKAKRTRRLYGLAGGGRTGTAIVRSANRMWLLTGTPMPNNPTELWTMLAGLAPVRIVPEWPLNLKQPQRPLTWEQFRARFCILEPTGFGSPHNPVMRVLGVQRSDELKRRLKGFALRRLKSNHLDLPAIRWGTVSLTGVVSAELRALEARLPSAGHLEDLRDSVEFSTWRRLCGAAKAPAAVELLADELREEPKKKIVVFAHHKEVVATLAAGLAEFGVIQIVGEATAAQRHDRVHRFQTEANLRVALCQIVAGGTGITLTAAHDVVFVESSFVPGENAQAADRCHRIGQKEPVAVRVLSLAGSVDELVAEIVARKASMIRSVLQQG